MRNAFGLVALTCALLVLSAAAATAGGGASPLTIEMKALNGSKLAGSATLTQNAAALNVTIEYKTLVFIPETMYPAHIHAGTCATLDPKPAFPLAAMNVGKSETDLKDVTLVRLLDKPYAIVVHDPKDLSRYISCGDIYPKPVETRSGY